MDQKTENLIDKKIDDLALAMHQGFEEVGKKFEDIDKRFEGVDKKLVSIDERFNEMETKSQERHNELMNSNDKMIRIFEASQQELASQKFITDKHEERLDNYGKRIKVLELHKAV